MLSVLPVEILLRVLSFVTVPGLARLLRVSKRFHSLVLQAMVDQFSSTGSFTRWELSMDVSFFLVSYVTLHRGHIFQLDAPRNKRSRSRLSARLCVQRDSRV